MQDPFISFSTLANGTRTNSTVTAPAGRANNDVLRYVLLLAAEPGPNPTPSPPTGFTQILHTDANNLFGATSVGDLSLWIWEHRIEDITSEPANYTATHASAISEAYMECIRDRVRAGSTEDFAATTNTVAGITSTYTANGGSTTRDGSFVTFIVGSWDTNNPMTPPPGSTPVFTERSDPAAGVLYVANGTMASFGATGNKAGAGAAQGTFGGYIAALISSEAEGSTFGALPVSSLSPEFHMDA